MGNNLINIIKDLEISTLKRESKLKEKINQSGILLLNEITLIYYYHLLYLESF